MAFALLPELLDRRVQAGMISYSAALGSCEKSRMWAQVLRSLCEMHENEASLCIDSHHLASTANLLHQVDVSDDVVDYNVHRFAYSPGLSSLSFKSMQRAVLHCISSCEMGC